MVIQFRLIQRQLVVKQDGVPAGQHRPWNLLAARLPLRQRGRCCISSARLLCLPCLLRACCRAAAVSSCGLRCPIAAAAAIRAAAAAAGALPLH